MGRQGNGDKISQEGNVRTCTLNSAFSHEQSQPWLPPFTRPDCTMILLEPLKPEHVLQGQNYHLDRL